MIDLSHLTEEEQVSIMRVLQRDAELRKVEEKRVRHVQESVKNEVQCKNMTGEWFYKAKAKRHKDTLHGAELIKASMRKKKPMTIYERLQSKELKENSKSFMNNIEKSVYVSPELSVFLEEPKLEDPHTSTTLHKNNSAPKPQPTPRQSTPSGKQRENPFNRTFLADDIPNGEKKSLQLVGTESVSVTPLAEKLSQPKENVSRLQTSSNEFLETKKPSLAEDGIYSEGHPVPKPRTISYKLQDSIPSSDQHHTATGLMNQNGFNGNSTTPKKSILKHSPSSSSNDSEILLVSVQDSKRKIAASPQTIPEGLAEISAVVDNEELLAPNSLERLKQVRFSTNVDEKKISPTLEFYNENKSSKIGEGSLLDTDYSEETIEENADGMDNAREDESLDEANGFSAQSHLSFLSEDPLNMDQDDNVMSNSDFQSIPATSSHIANHTNNHLASSGSGKLTNRVREMDTGEILTENKVNRRLNSASNLANHSVDKQIPHTEFESPQVSNQQPAKIFQGRSPLVEENDIPQKNLNNSESLDNMIHGNLKTVEEDKLSSIKNDKGSKYNENLGIDLNKDNRGFDLQDQFQMELNLPSGTTRTSTFKENSDSPTKRSMESFKAGAQDNPDQDASSKNVLLDYSRGSDHLHAETWRSSLSEEEEGSSLALKRNSRTSETYKSLQDIHVISSRMPNTLDSTNQEMLLSADNVSSIPTTPENTSLQSKRMKRLSKSVPAFPENDDADSMSEGSFQMDKHGTIASSLTNISGSSGMASRSSVSGSTMSIYSSDIGNIDVRGKIQFSLDYVDKLKEFHIFVVRCSDLAAAEEKKNRSDPYVKSYLLPDKIKTGKRKTTVKKRTLNPVYNEILRYKIDKASLMAQTLNLSVWHNDTFGRNSFLGEVEVELRKWDWSNKKMDWHDLKPRTISANRTGDKGSLKVAFRYIPQGYKGKKTGEVQIWVKEASNLPQIRPSRLDPFVKCFILPDTSRKSRQKTRVVKKSTNPVFNHTMVYDGFSTEDLKDACVELSVWDHDKLINHFLGGLRIGLGTGKSYGLTVDWMDSTEEEISVWDKMMTHPNTWVEDVLPLRMLMLSKMSGT
ncbi:synaptotagmin-like protein 2 isoform X3 [Chiloscyllium plagiosum]|uniref:synaptotagmin-like protein 2 isoform X3 n=1 Tax=Chiloscyllium plagiosum TaxID=36176 RepID=UPI001CB7DA61|nr:synaptotagmin-like protein 2 isoform X3 [Chiloscyllium plagiosum]XP_043547544.1 synaptotagmin-like protein 2 isoform X3 [Chiloscyllium plagiosum]